MSKLDDMVEEFKTQAPSVVKNNKGALVGALVGYLLTDSKEAQSTVMGLLAGSVLVDGTKPKETRKG